MTRKITISCMLVFAVAVIAVAAIPVSVGVGEAATVSDSPSIGDMDELRDIGYDLNGYEVEIGYYSYTLKGSGVYFAFELTLDKNFRGRIERSRCSAMFLELKKIFYEMGYTVRTDSNNGQILGQLNYSSTTDYYIATGRDGYEVGTASTPSKKGFFFNEYSSASVSPFSIIEEEGNILNVIYEMCLNLGADKQKILLSYYYGTPYKIIDTDADIKKVDYDKSVYVHRFNMTLEDKDRELHFTQRSTNAWAFYLLAVLAAVPVIAVPLVISIKKQKKKEGYNDK